jgi:RNase P/RNase MRP subunit p30
MKNTYADLHLCVNLNDFEQVSRVVNKAARLGYRLVGVPFPPVSSEASLKRMEGICEDARVGLVSRVDLRPRTPEELLGGLRKFRRRFEVVAVMCESKVVARQAAKDRRVDLLNFPQFDYRRRFFDAAEGELASGGLASLEIDVKPLLVLEGAERVRLLSSLRREVAVARRFCVPVVLSSGVSDEMLMRNPLDLAALAGLFDFGGSSAVEAVSRNPVAIVKRNRLKLSHSFVAPGIRVVREGRDC